MRPWMSLARLPVLLAPAMLLACGEDLGPRTPAAVVVTPNAPRIPMGETRQLTATVVDADGRAISGEPVTFESSQPSVLTVSETGLLTSVGPVGTSLITAATGDITAEIEAEVILAPSELFVSPASLTLESDESVLLSITVTDENSDSIPDAEFVVHTSNAAIASVSVDGWVTGGEAGTTTVYVTSGDLRRDIPVTVTQTP